MTAHNQKYYNLVVTEFPDSLIVQKNSHTDSCRIAMTTHNNISGEITIRSKEMAEALYFMLGQMLGCK